MYIPPVNPEIPFLQLYKLTGMKWPVSAIHHF